MKKSTLTSFPSVSPSVSTLLLFDTCSPESSSVRAEPQPLCQRTDTKIRHIPGSLSTQLALPEIETFRRTE